MNRLFYDSTNQKIQLKSLTSLEIIAEQQNNETVQEFLKLIDDKDATSFDFTLADNFLLGDRMQDDNIYRGVVLEGIPATYAQTLEIINNLANVTNLRPSQINEIISLKRAWDYVLEPSNYENEQPIHLDFIKKIHSIIGANMASLNIEQIGKLRTTPIHVGGVKNHDFGIPIEEEIVVEVEKINETADPVIRAFKLFLYICRMQMFRDGNKRTANLCANYALIQNACGLLTIKEDLVHDFKVLLINWYVTGQDLEIMNFLLNKCYVYNLAGETFL